MNRKVWRVFRLESNKKENEEDWEDARKEKEKKLGLSDEAKLSEEEKKQVKKLGDNRFLVSSSPIEDEDVEKGVEELEKMEKEENTEKDSKPDKKEKGLKEEISEKLGKKEKTPSEIDPNEIAEAIVSKLGEKSTTESVDKKSEQLEKAEKNRTNKPKTEKKNPLKEPENLVKLLSTYKVSLDSPVRKLVKKIKKEGKEHLQKQIREME